jgi:hypothetical protein
MLFMATVRLIALFGPPIVMSKIIRSPGTSLEQLPHVFHLYVDEISRVTGMTATAIWMRLASQILAELLLVFLAVVLLLRKPWSRMVALAVFFIYSLQHSHAAFRAFAVGPRRGIQQVSWALIYVGLMLVFTRPSIAALFGLRAGDSLDVAKSGISD